LDIRWHLKVYSVTDKGARRAHHCHLTDKAERTQFIKDLAIAAALMVIAAGASQIRAVASIG